MRATYDPTRALFEERVRAEKVRAEKAKVDAEKSAQYNKLLFEQMAQEKAWRPTQRERDFLEQLDRPRRSTGRSVLELDADQARREWKRDLLDEARGALRLASRQGFNSLHFEKCLSDEVKAGWAKEEQVMIDIGHGPGWYAEDVMTQAWLRGRAEAEAPPEPEPEPVPSPMKYDWLNSRWVPREAAPAPAAPAPARKRRKGRSVVKALAAARRRKT